MPEPRETAPDLLPDLFNAFPKTLRAIGDGQPLIDALAEILPAYDSAKEREVRAKVAEEIETTRMPLPDPEYVRGLMDAAAIARGEQP